jgi:hypothetical protein
MIRTRHVFVVGACMVLLGIVSLITVLSVRSELGTVAALSDVSSDVSVYTVSTQSNTKDRASLRERLRALILDDTSLVTPNPSVEEDTPPIATTSDQQQVDQGVLISCGGDDTATAKAVWPSGVYMRIDGTLRSAVLEIAQVDTPTASTSTSTPQVPTLQTLWSARAFPVKSQTSQCVPGSIVGIAQSGQPIVNNALGYTERTSESLIGYARDGFPIYGFYEGVVDSCGGYQHPTGYRYTLSEGRSTVLNCFMSVPSPITI